MSYGSTKSAGVAILKGSFQGKILKNVIHDSGRWIILVVEYMGNIFILGNIYGHNNSQRNTILFAEFEGKINTLLKSFINAKLILGGDWNCINDPIKDCYPHRSLKATFGQFYHLCLHLNCCDVWRLKNPNQIQFTWNNKDLSKRSRIDFWLISNDLLDSIEETKIEPSVFSDHNMIKLVVCLKNPLIKYRPNHWKLNNTLLSDKLFKEKTIKIITENLTKAKKDQMYSKHWEYTKFQIRNIAIQRGKEISKEKRSRQDRIIKEIILLYEKDEHTQKDMNTLVELQSELDNIYKNLARGAFIRSRRKWMEHGERNTKYFHNLEKRNININSIFKLKINEQISEDPKLISNFTKEFYEKLYSDQHNNLSSNFLSHIKNVAHCIDETQREICDQDISLQEIKKNFSKLKNNKSPGNDGLTGEFYKVFQEYISEFLLFVFKEAIEVGKLPPSMCQGLITLLPKPNKDCLLLDNWRPITLINNDVKLLAHVFAQRIKLCLDTIIDDSQSGFMQGRHISNNIRLILDLIDYKDYINDNSYILFIDIYKAFDTVQHDFLFNLLEFFGFGPYFIRAIQTLYNDCNSSVKLPWGTTHRFNISRGIKQGDPAAPFLFLLVMQTLTLLLHKDSFQGIRIGDKEIKCCQLADDTAIFLKDVSQVKRIIECIKTFSKVSGLHLNIKKCTLFPIKDNDIPFTEFEGIPIKEEVTYLGINICKDQTNRTQSNFQPLLSKIKKRFDIWLMRDLSLKGRILLSKTEGLSRLVYPAKVLDVPKYFLKKVDSALFNFIWKNKPHYLNKNILCNSYNQGGLNVLDFVTSNTIFKLNWIKHYTKHKDKIWYIIPNLIFEKVGGIEFLLKCDFEVNKLPIQLSNFHRQTLLYWNLIYKHNFSPHRQIIWNNKYVKYKNKMIFYNNWIENGILLVSQLINNEGHLLTYSEFLKKFGIPIPPYEYSIVIDAIPAGFVRLLQGHNESKQSTFKKEILLNGINIKDKKCNNTFFRYLIHCPATFRCKYFWNNLFENINWKLIWTYNNKFCVTNKVNETYFKIIHMIYPTNLFLKRYKNDLNDFCVFCGMIVESILHLFFECIYVKYFWIDIECLFGLLSGSKINISKRDVIFFCDKKDMDNSHNFMLNLLILLGKYYIHKCKWSEIKPSISHFKIDLRNYFETLQGLSSRKAIRTLTILKKLNSSSLL